jgi:diguanylate cyclase (GGDEF)-like protein
MSLLGLRNLRLSVGTWLALVSLAALLPMLALLVLSTAKLITDQQSREAASLARRSAVAADQLASELTLRRRLLEALADSEVARAGDFAALHRFASRVAASDELIRAISLTDPDGRQLLNTATAFGSPLPNSRLRDLERPLFDSGRPLVSPLVTGTVTGEPLVGIAVPLRDQSGVVRFSLRAALKPAAVSEVLARQRWPSDWTASVIDQRGAIVARSREPDRFLGQPATDSLRAMIATGGEASGEATTKDGVRVLASVAPVGATGWFVAVGKPAEPLAAQLREALVLVGGAGSLLVVGGALASFLLGRRVVRAVQSVAGGGDGSGSVVKELGQIHGRLDDAALMMQRANAELHDARHDALTGLAARGLFLVQLAGLAASRPTDGELAVLFVDLDGFKGINDRLGHEAGDRALVDVARVLKSHVRSGDLVGRLGGDEFVVALAGPASSLQGVGEGVAMRVIESVAALGQGLGCSIGLALQSGGESPEDLLQRADHAMLSAKQRGKNQLVLAASA